MEGGVDRSEKRRHNQGNVDIDRWGWMVAWRVRESPHVSDLDSQLDLPTVDHAGNRNTEDGWVWRIHGGFRWNIWSSEFL